MTILALIFAGLGRAVVGGGWISRGYVYPPVALFTAYVGFGQTWEALAFAIISGATLWLGWTKWEDPIWMTLRYGLLPTCISIAYYMAYGDPFPLFWAFACALIGGLYWALLETFQSVRYEIKGYAIDSSRITEFLAGAVIIGGTALL